jgi:hypothetical protein
MFTVVLNQLKEAWKRSDFRMDRDELLRELPKVLDGIDPVSIS